MSLKNKEKKYQFKVTELPQNTGEGIAVYFKKLHKEQERLKKSWHQLGLLAKGNTGVQRDVIKSNVW